MTAAPTIADWRVYETPQRQPILQAALDEFVIHGYEGTSVRRIASRVGVTVPALYYHFANKQALLVELLDQGMQQLQSHLELALAEARAAQTAPDPRADLATAVEAIVYYMTQLGDTASMDSEMRSLTTENRASYVAQRDRIEQVVYECIRAGIAAKVFTVPWPADANRALLTMLQGIASWYRPDGELAPSDIAERHVHLALNLVGATTSTVPPHNRGKNA